MDLRGRSRSPRCPTVLECRWTVRMAVIDLAGTSRTITQQIQSVMHHLVSARTFRLHFQHSRMSARLPLPCLPLTRNHMHLHFQWCDQRQIWTTEGNGIVFTHESRFCLQHHDGWILVRIQS
ncbi:transposable element Tcb1 transposase [Trichonephila clavipes]|nr:transposable element Tcb1 transposase [Trichonephila clavipes]